MILVCRERTLTGWKRSETEVTPIHVKVIKKQLQDALAARRTANPGKLDCEVTEIGEFVYDTCKGTNAELIEAGICLACHGHEPECLECQFCNGTGNHSTVPIPAEKRSYYFVSLSAYGHKVFACKGSGAEYANDREYRVPQLVKYGYGGHLDPNAEARGPYKVKIVQGPLEAGHWTEEDGFLTFGQVWAKYGHGNIVPIPT